MEKKNWKEKHPKLAKFIDEKAPQLGNVIGGILPDKGFLGIVKNLITSSPDVSAEDKLEFLKLEAELIKNEGEQVTERHKADMGSDSWMSKNVRPIALLYLLFLFTILAILDSSMERFKVEDIYVELLKVLLVSVFCFYFGGRTIEKMLTTFKK